jgi:hypothetical protein
MRALPLLAVAVVAAFAFTPAAEAAQGRKRALATGALLGAAGIAGAAILLNQRPARAAPVVEEEEIIERPAPRYVPTCRIVRKRVWLDDDTYTFRRVEVCE